MHVNFLKVLKSIKTATFEDGTSELGAEGQKSLIRLDKTV